MSDSDSPRDTSDLSFSSIFSRTKEAAGVDAVLKEVNELETQVSDLNDLLRSLKLQAEDRRARYSSDLSDLNKQISTLKQKADADLRALAEAQEREYQDVVTRHEDNLHGIMRGTKGVDSTARGWGKTAKGINDLQEDYEMSRVQERFYSLENEVNEEEILRRSRAAERQSAREARRANQEAMFEMLHEDMMRIAANGRQQAQQYEILIGECLQVREDMVRAHDACIAAMRTEAEKRQELFERHLSFVKQVLEKEHERCENDRKNAKDSIEHISAMRRDTSRRCSVQLQSAQKDIERINALLKNPVDESRFNSSMMKSEMLQRENVALSQELQQLEEELERVNGTVLAASSELKRSAKASGSARSPMTSFK